MNLENKISQWIKNYAINAKMNSLIIGVSGGIDSSVVSTLCAMTGLNVIIVILPIRQSKKTHDLSLKHSEWLLKKFDNVKCEIIDLTEIFELFEKTLNKWNSNLAFANTRSRLRMITLYQIAQSCSSGLVVGTGNKIEDFGVGFFTKYGDGGVDISPIADLTKTEVWDMGKRLGILNEIIDAPPTDGLWDDGRNDSDQLNGLSYKDLERAMELVELNEESISEKDKEILRTYKEIRSKNLHKMNPIPIFKKM
jgi:NAD+ synthase